MIFLVNVLKKEIVFAKEFPVIKVTAVDKETTGRSQNQNNIRKGSQQNNQRETEGGRKRSATKLEDEHFVKRLKMAENVKKNERQIKHMEELNQGIWVIDN